MYKNACELTFILEFIINARPSERVVEYNEMTTSRYSECFSVNGKVNENIRTCLGKQDVRVMGVPQGCWGWSRVAPSPTGKSSQLRDGPG